MSSTTETLTIAGLTEEQAARVAFHGLEAKFRKLATAKRGPAAEKLDPIPAAPEAEAPTPSQTADLIADLMTQAQPQAPRTVTLAELHDMAVAAGWSVSDVAASRPEDLAAALDLEEVVIDLTSPTPGQALADFRPKRSHYEAHHTTGAEYRSAAALNGERVLYAPGVLGGMLHLNSAKALWGRGFREGSPVTPADILAYVPAGSDVHSRYGSPASAATALHRLANADGFILVHRAEGGKRAVAKTLTRWFFQSAAYAAVQQGRTDACWIEMIAAYDPHASEA